MGPVFGNAARIHHVGVMRRTCQLPTLDLMNVVWAGLIIVVVTSSAITAMLVVRSRAPDGGYFTDSDRAAGIFGVIATGFSVLLGLLVFLGFESYDSSRRGAEEEALVVAQQIQTAQLLPADVSAPLTGELVCYARSVIHDEWQRMEDNTLGDDINEWGVALFQTIREVETTTPEQQSAYDQWLEQTSTREVARQERIHGATGILPAPLWIGLFLITTIVVGYLFGFADSSDRKVVQALFMGSVVAVISTMLLLLTFLDDPFHDDIGGLQPTAMERTERLIDQQLAVLGADISVPCDELGSPA